MRNNNIKIRVYYSSNKFINFLIYNSVFYDKLVKYNSFYELIIDYNDLYKFNRYEIIIIKYYGIKGIINFINYNKYILLGIIFGLFIINLLSNTIFNININSNDESLVNIIELSLKDNGIVKYKKKKSYNEIQIIKESILNTNKDSLEWIEIIEDGCNYIVEVTKKVINSGNDNNNFPSNIIASKDALITHINLISGVKLKDINDYVKKGDIIITGNIYKGDKLINQIPSKGGAFGEVWYTTKVTIPFEYTEYVYTNRWVNRYYVKIFNREFTITGKYDSNKTINENKLILDKPYLPFDIYKETKKIYEYKKYEVSQKEAYDEALKRADNNIKKMLENEEYVIYKKVLKKEVFRSKMILEVFYKVYENIGSTSRIEEVISDQ